MSTPAHASVVLVTKGTPKGTGRSAQEYVNPLLVLTGKDYVTITFADLHTRICDALRRGEKSRVIAQYLAPGGYSHGTLRCDPLLRSPRCARNLR